MPKRDRLYIRFTETQLAQMRQIMTEQGFKLLSTWIREQIIRPYIEDAGIPFSPSVQAGGYRPKIDKENNDAE